MATSTNRITGLATGLDIDSIVKSTMQGYQNKIDKVYKQKSIAEIKQQLYRDVISEGQDFYNNYFDLTKSGNLLSGSNFSSISYITGDESVATATASSSAIKNNYSIDITQKAEAAKASLESSVLGFSTDADGKYKLANDIQISSGTEGTTVIIKKEDIASAGIKSDKELAKYINNKASAAGFKAYVSDFTPGKITIETKETGSDKKFTISAGTIVGEHVDSAGYGTLKIDNLLNDTANYDKQDIELTYDGKTIVIPASTLRDSVSTYTSNKKSVTDLASKLSEDTLSKDYLSNVKAVRTYLNSEKAALKDTDPDYEAKSQAFKDKIDKVSAIIDKFGSFDSITLTPEEKSLLSGECQNAKNYDDEKTQSTIKDTLDGVLKAQFGKVSDAEDALGKVTASVEADGTISFSNGSYKVGKRIYAQISGGTSPLNSTNYSDGKDLFGTVETSTGTITYGSGENEVKQGSNVLNVDGTSITINKKGKTDLTAKNDVTALKDKIVKFVNDYNTYMTKLNTLVTEKKYRDYEPLTDEQKKDMKESEITAWEAKVKSGQLRGDSDLERIQNNLKNAMTNMVSGSGMTLKDMGISLVESYGTTKDGTFSIDEDKLTTALQDKTEEVTNLFTMKGDSDSTTGIAYRMKNILYDEVVSTTKSSIINKAGLEGTTSATTSTLAKQIKEYKDKLDDLKDWYDDKEQALYSKWANIETIMNNYNSQSSYLSSMFNSGS